VVELGSTERGRRNSLKARSLLINNIGIIEFGEEIFGFEEFNIQ
jgi:hypothetical protein